MVSTTLYEWRNRQVQRRFDPKNKKDLQAYKFFLMEGHWDKGLCPFMLEWPYLTVPDMINDRITHSTLGVDKRWR